MGQRPANVILLSILDGVPRAGLVLRVVKLPAMKSSLWGWWWAVGKGRGKESCIYNHFVGCARMTGVLGSGMSSVGCSDRPCLIWTCTCMEAR